jgi:hypothetical protein
MKKGLYAALITTLLQGGKILLRITFIARSKVVSLSQLLRSVFQSIIIHLKQLPSSAACHYQPIK